MLKSLHHRLGIIGELFQFMWKNKLWWLVPVIFITLFLLLFLHLAGSTGVAAFIYPIF
jgi:hypothetical protein